MNWVAAGRSCVAHYRFRAKRVLRIACGTDKGADLVDILLTGCAFDARRHIDTGCMRDAQRLSDIVGIETAREHERNCEIEILEQPPVERRAEPARPRRLAR